MLSSFEDSDPENKATEEEIRTEVHETKAKCTKEVHETKAKQPDDEIINSKISTGDKTTSNQLLLMINNIKSSFDDFKKEYRLTSRVQPEKSLMPQAYNVHPPQAYTVFIRHRRRNNKITLFFINDPLQC